MEDNKRQCERIAVTLMADYISPRAMTFDYMRDLSAGGAFLCSDAVDAVGTPVSLLFRLPTMPVSLSVIGRVMWTRRPDPADDSLRESGMGVMFTDISPEARKALADFIRSSSSSN